MKRPILNQIERQDIKLDTIYSALLKLKIAIFHFRRELHKTFINLIQ